MGKYHTRGRYVSGINEALAMTRNIAVMQMRFLNDAYMYWTLLYQSQRTGGALSVRCIVQLKGQPRYTIDFTQLLILTIYA